MSQTQTAAPTKERKKKSAKAPKTEAQPTGPDADGIYGELAPEILSGVSMMRARANELLLDMGRIELQKANIISEIERLNEEANRLFQSEAQRLGIPTDTPWRMTPEGKAMVMEG